MKNAKRSSDILKRLAPVFKKAGIRLTSQRIEIYRVVARSCTHPDAEKVYRLVRRKLPTISLDTVYRTLWLLEGLGLLNALVPFRERTRFDGVLDRHHHFVCMRCGLMQDVRSKILDGFRLPSSVDWADPGQPLHIEINGLCVKCSKKRKGKNDQGRESTGLRITGGRSYRQ